MTDVAEKELEFQTPKYIFHGFMERLWAYLTIHQLLEQMWVNASHPRVGTTCYSPCPPLPTSAPL